MLVLASPLTAQPRNCNVTSQAFDSPISFGASGSWRMPRYAWHAVAVSEAIVVTEAAHRVGLSRRMAGLIAPLASLALHLVGWRMGKYRVNARDWAFDVAVRSLPLTFPRPAVGLPIYAAAYVSTVCYSSP